MIFLKWLVYAIYRKIYFWSETGHSLDSRKFDCLCYLFFQKYQFIVLILTKQESGIIKKEKI